MIYNKKEKNKDDDQKFCVITEQGDLGLGMMDIKESDQNIINKQLNENPKNK